MLLRHHFALSLVRAWELARNQNLDLGDNEKMDGVASKENILLEFVLLEDGDITFANASHSESTLSVVPEYHIFPKCNDRFCVVDMLDIHTSRRFKENMYMSQVSNRLYVIARQNYFVGKSNYNKRSFFFMLFQMISNTS